MHNAAAAVPDFSLSLSLPIRYEDDFILSHVAEKAEEVAEEGGGRKQAGFKPEKEERGIKYWRD